MKKRCVLFILCMMFLVGCSEQNEEIRNSDAGLFEKSICWHTRWIYANRYNRNTEKAKEKRKIKWEKSKLQNVVELRD